MKLFWTIILILPSLAFAKDPYAQTTVPASQCRDVGHPGEYVQKFCATLSANNDLVVIQGNKLRNNLMVTDNKKGNRDRFLGLGLVNADYGVTQGDIKIITKNGQRHAIVYRLDYETHNGKKGFQIITLKVSKKDFETCTMAVYDSSTFKGSNIEAQMRKKAESFYKDEAFKTKSCFSLDQIHESGTPSQEDIMNNEQHGVEAGV